MGNHGQYHGEGGNTSGGEQHLSGCELHFDHLHGDYNGDGNVDLDDQDRDYRDINDCETDDL